MVEVGGIENGCFGNFLPTINLRDNVLFLLNFQFLFGFVWLCIFQGVFHSTWHKSGTKLLPDYSRHDRFLWHITMYALKSIPI